MAKIFRAIFDEMLPKEDLVELEGRERLPSPQELQGKIILKGSFKVQLIAICIISSYQYHSTSAIVCRSNVCKKLPDFPYVW